MKPRSPRSLSPCLETMQPGSPRISRLRSPFRGSSSPSRRPLAGASSPCHPQGSPGRATQPSADKVPVRKMNKLDAVTTTATKDQDSVLKNTDGAAKNDVNDTSAAGI